MGRGESFGVWWCSGFRIPARPLDSNSGMHTLCLLLALAMLGKSVYIHALKSFGSMRPRAPLHRMCSTDTGSTPTSDQLTELSRLEIRVGRIVEVGLHPDADNLFVGTLPYHKLNQMAIT